MAALRENGVSTSEWETTLKQLPLEVRINRQKDLIQNYTPSTMFVDLDQMRLPDRWLLDKVHTVGSYSREQAETVVDVLLESVFT